MFALPPPPATLLEILEDAQLASKGWAVVDSDKGSHLDAPQTCGSGYDGHECRLLLGGRRTPRLSDEHEW